MGGHGSHPYYFNYTVGDNYSESLRLEFDGVKTTFADLLDEYWSYLYKAGANFSIKCGGGPGYCFSIFYVDSAQKQIAEASLANQQKKYKDEILVPILPASDYTFWKGEEYHQQRLRREGIECSVVPPTKCSETRKREAQAAFFA